MSLSIADLSTLSCLLDEAFDLDAAQREAWLAALPEAHHPLRPQLREMLSAQGTPSHADFLASGPRWSDSAEPTHASGGDLIGPYRLIREIGRGGMGTVWLAERADGNLKRQVALKLPRLAWGSGLAERMARERDIGALLTHPHIARLYDAGVDALGRPYLALEYIDGQALDVWCEMQALGVPQRLSLFLQIARAVAYAHGRLVVHRDLKPSNVLVTADGQAHLLDFGIAKLLHEAASGDAGLTQEQGRMLTPHYASPEQLRGEAITVATDVYSLGVLLYELLAGCLPHAAENRSMAALEEAVLEGEPPLASQRARSQEAAKALRGELDAILAKALKGEPALRYATADALADDIERHLSGERVLAQPDRLGYRLRKTLRRNRVAFGATGAIALAVLGGAGVALVQAQRANAEAERARAVKEFVVDVFKVNERGNPANNELRQLPVEQLVARGARLIDIKFAGQPQMQAELYGVVAGLFVDMGSPGLAVEYATRQVDALVAVGADEADQAVALLLLAKTLARDGKLADAQARAERAIGFAASGSMLAVRARLMLAEVLMRRAQYPLASETLDLADKDRAAHTGSLTIEEARVAGLRAELLYRSSDYKKATPLYEHAIETALRVEGPLSPTAVTMRLKYVDLLTESLQAKEAQAQLAAALAAMRASGGDDDPAAAHAEVSSLSAMVDFLLIPAEQAITAIDRARKSIDAHGRSVPAIVRANLDLAFARRLSAWGNAELAYSLANQATPVVRQSTDDPAMLLFLAQLMSVTAANAGHDAEAGAELQKALLHHQVVYANKPEGPAMAARFAAFFQMMQNRFDEAEATLENAPSVQGANGQPDTGSRRATLMTASLAMLKYLHGKPQQALALLDQRGVVADLGASTGSENPVFVRAASGCALGRAREGLPTMEELTAKLAAMSYVHSPDVAHMRSLTGLCALQAGQIARAKELAELARRAFIAQPGVSSFFKAPLQQLEQKLRQG